MICFMNAESLFYVTMIPNGTNALTWHFHSVQLESDVPGSFVLHKIKKPDKYKMQKLCLICYPILSFMTMSHLTL